MGAFNLLLHIHCERYNELNFTKNTVTNTMILLILNYKEMASMIQSQG